MNCYPLARRAVASILVLALAVPVPAAVTAGSSGGARAPLAPYAGAASQAAIVKLHHVFFSHPKSSHLWDLAPITGQKIGPTNALILQAATAPGLSAAGQVVFGQGLDPVPEQMLAEIVLELRARMQQDPELAKIIMTAELAAQLHYYSMPKASLKASPSFAQLEKVLEDWRPGQDALTRLDELSPAALAWRQAYQKDLVVPTLDEIQAAFPPGQSGGRGFGGGGGFKRKGAAPEEAGEAATDIRDYILAVFDADDNLFEFNTVYLFKKGTNYGLKERIGVSTREWAHIRHHKSMEPGGKYQDYETWDDVEKGSFWEFRSLPGGKNILLANAKKALRDKPKHLWQGYSFDELAYFLNEERAAKGVYFLSASGVSPEHFLETLEFLRDQGAFGPPKRVHLPPLKNIRMVAHPSHPYKGSTANPSEAKVRDMMDFLDAQQAKAVALGDKAPLLLNADGTRRERLLPAGFSDDDLKNFEVMWAGLAPEVKKGRWNKLKITIFYTDKENTGRATGAYVMKSDGTEREATLDEHNEYYWDNVKKATYGQNEKPLPRPDVVRHPAKSFDEVIDKMYITVDAPVNHPKVETNVDQIALETGKMRDFIRREVPAGWKKRIVMERYSVSAPEVAAVFEEAKDAGVPATLITDFNTSLDYDFAPGEEMITDYSKTTPNKREAGIFIKRLMDKGYKLHDAASQWVIYSQPLYNHNDKDRDPIMHRKATFMILEGPNGEREIQLLNGTGNLANGAMRYNRIIETHDPLIAGHALENADRTIEAFRKNLPIHKIRAARPARFVFENDESLEAGYTDGQYNFNDRMNAPLKRTVDDPEHYQLLEWDMYHFVPGYKPTFEALKAAMEKHPNARGFMVSDMKFSAQKGWGRAAAVNGFLNIHPMGPSDFAWSYGLRQRIESYVYMRGLPGVPQLDLEGPPVATFVFHDKTSQFLIAENGTPWAYISWGSFNNSGNYHNAEWQWLARVKPDSPWHKITRDSALGHAKAHPEWAIQGWRAPLIDTMARLVGQSPIDALPAFRPIELAIKDGAWTRLSFLLQELVSKGTTLVRDTFAPPDAVENLARFLILVGWQQSLPGAGQMYASQVSLPALALAYKDNSPYDIKAVLRSFIWSRDLSREQQDSLVEWAWQRAGIDAHLKRMAELQQAERAGTPDGNGA